MKTSTQRKLLLVLLAMVVVLACVCLSACNLPIGKVTLSRVEATYTGEDLHVGESLSKDDFVVKKVFSDGRKVVTQDFTINGYDNTICGEQYVSIVSGGKTATLVVNCFSVQLSSLQVSLTNPSKQFFIGDELLQTDLTVIGTYNNGTTATITNYTVDGFDSTQAQMITLTISVGDVIKQYAVLIQQPPIILTSLSASLVDDQVAYYVDGSFSKSNLVVTAYLSDESNFTVDTEDFDVFYDFDTAGEKDVTVSYTKDNITQTQTVSVTVKEDEIVSISAVHDDHQYLQNERSRIDRKRITVTLNYKSGKKVVTTTFGVTGFSNDDKKLGTQTITVSYPSSSDPQFTTTFDIVVLSATSISLDSITASYKGNVVQNGNIDKEKLTVIAKFSDGTSTTVDVYEIDSYSTAVIGSATLQVSYTFGGVTKSCQTQINVVDSAPVCADVQIHFLELGNNYTGDCTLIDCGDVEILIDAGSRQNSAKVINKYIDQYCKDGVLEYVIATHAHQDHIAGFVGNSISGGRDGVLYQNNIGTIIQFAQTNATSTVYKNYVTGVNYAKSQGANVFTALDCYNNAGNGASRVYEIGEGVKMEILYNYFYENKSSDENNYSVCMLLTQGNKSYLFTGDLEKDGEEKLVEYNELPVVELFKGGHHGSYTASNDCLLKVIQPKRVCVCCCAGSVEYTQTPENTFPSQAFINRVSKWTDEVYVTTMGYVVYDEAKKKYKDDGYTSFNGNIVVDCKYLNSEIIITVTGSNNSTKLKDTDWFKENRTCPSYWQ